VVKKVASKAPTGKQHAAHERAEDEWARIHALAPLVMQSFGSDRERSAQLAEDLAYWREHDSELARTHTSDEPLVFDPGCIPLGARSERFVDHYTKYLYSLEAERLAKELATATNTVFAKLASDPDASPLLLQAMRRALLELLSVGEHGMPMRYGDGRLRTEWALCWIESAAKASFLIVRKADSLVRSPVKISPPDAVTRVCAHCCINIANGGDDLQALGPLQEPVLKLFDREKAADFIASFREAVGMRLGHEIEPCSLRARALRYSEVAMPDWPGDSAFSVLLKRHDDGDIPKAFAQTVDRLSVALARHVLQLARFTPQVPPPSNGR